MPNIIFLLISAKTDEGLWTLTAGGGFPGM